MATIVQGLADCLPIVRRVPTVPLKNLAYSFLQRCRIVWADEHELGLGVLSKMSNVCLSQFPHLYNEGNNSTGPAGMW